MQLKDLPVGSKVSDVSSNWEFKTGSKYTGSGIIKPVVWTVVAQNHYKDNSTLLHVVQAIATYQFHDTRTNKPWETRLVRNFLRTTFYSHFSDNFKSTIVEVLTQTEQSANIVDNIFVLDAKEYNSATAITAPFGNPIPYFNDTNRYVGYSNYAQIARNPRPSNIDGLGFVHPVGIVNNGLNCDSTSLALAPVVNLSNDTYVKSIPNEFGVYEIIYPITKHLIKSNNKIHISSDGKLVYPNLTTPTQADFELWGMDGLDDYASEVSIVNIEMDEDGVLSDGRIVRKVINKNDFKINSLNIL